MAVYVSRKRKVEESVEAGVKLLCVKMLKFRLLIDFSFHRANQTWTLFSQCGLVTG